MNVIFTWLFSFLAMLAAMLMVFTRSILYGACALIICLLSLAALYMISSAEFVGVTQLMIYVGGIIILLLFAIMLTHRLKGQTLVTRHHNRPLAVILFLVAAGVLTRMTWVWENAVSSESGPQELMKETGILLMTSYLVPMELVAVLLLLVLIGALTIAGENYRKEGNHD